MTILELLNQNVVDSLWSEFDERFYELVREIIEKKEL